MAEVTTKQLGATLVESGYLSQLKLNEALSEQKRTGRMLGRVLIENNFVTEEQLAKVIATQQSLPYIDLRRYDVVPETVMKLTELQARRFHAIVLEDRETTYLIGMTDPSNLRAHDELSGILGRPLDIAVITNEQFGLTVDRIYRKTSQIGEYAREVERDVERETGVVDIGQMNVSIDDMDAPVIKLLQTIFEEAAQMRASDIHIEPQEKKLVVRFRIDGSMHHQVDADQRIAAALLVRVKLLAGLDIAEKRLPQDGRIAVKVGSSRIDIRMSTLPTQFGESVVMRLLVQSQGMLDLSKSGMPADMLEKFYRVIESPHGIILVTGPTGSGKSTTLYGALERLNQPNVKILTCEDPVEYRIPGINQVQVNDKIELTFARVLRSFLRQDPDILLVGEIRDQETAQIAARAAMTGHLVLSSLHTNDSVSTPVRLLDMGVPGYMIATTLLTVISQRLLRKVCTHCAEPYSPTETEMEWVKHYLMSDDHLNEATFRHGKGCVRCNGIGFSGRTGVHEMLEMTSPLAAAIHNNDIILFEKLGHEQLGKNSLAHRALELALNGETTVAEAMTIVSSVDS